MLIVVAILAVLMTMVFRLTNLGNSDNRRTTTVVRLQKVENCLSGYYAAFGSYPPVKDHGWREIDHPVDANGDQSESSGGGANNQRQSGESLVWSQVEAACRCQPFGCEYPPSESSSNGKSEKEVIEEWSKEVASRIGNSEDYPKYSQGVWSKASIFQSGSITGPRVNEGGFVSEWDNADWKAIKLFKFGVMSFLLPRYLFMTGGDRKCFGLSGEACAQWGDNNDMPSDPFTGRSYDDQYGGWEDIRNFAQIGTAENNINRQDLARVANIPSQAVCARWMPNLEGLCWTLKTMKFFGINISGSTGLSAGWEGSDGEIYPPSPMTHYPPGGKGSAYRNATVTIYDGWGTEFFYYSPPPYQTYTLWSAGPNEKTFPPWVSLDDLESNERETAQKWKNDDIMQMSH